MNLYNYLMTKSGQNATKAARMAAEAFARFKENAKHCADAQIDAFEFTFLDGKGYESFAWKPNDVVNVAPRSMTGKTELGIVSGYVLICPTGWTVVVQTASSKDVRCSVAQLSHAQFPPGLVEIICKKFGKGEVD
jgi:hypothetical protein